MKNYFAASPLRLTLDPSLTLQAAIRSVLLEAKKRQQESPGTQVVGTVIQHLVGAKLETLYPERRIQHHGANVADTLSKRTGDFFINETVIHVTTSPSENLLRVCQSNLQQGHSALIVTTANGIVTIQTLTAGTPLENRIETVELEQFLVVNLAERAAFDPATRKKTVEQLLGVYNRIIEECETDPGLKIEIA